MELTRSPYARSSRLANADLDGKHSQARPPQQATDPRPPTSADRSRSATASTADTPPHALPSARGTWAESATLRPRPLPQTALRAREAQAPAGALPDWGEAPFEYGACLGRAYLLAGAGREPLATPIALLLSRGLAHLTPDEHLPRLLSGFAQGLQLADRKPSFVEALVETLLAQASIANLTTPQLQSALHAVAMARGPGIHDPCLRVDYATVTVLGLDPAQGPVWQKLLPAQAHDLCNLPAPASRDAPPPAVPAAIAPHPAWAAAWANGLAGMYLEPLWTMSAPEQGQAAAGLHEARPPVEGASSQRESAKAPFDADPEDSDEAPFDTLERASDEPWAAPEEPDQASDPPPATSDRSEASEASDVGDVGDVGAAIEAADLGDPVRCQAELAGLEDIATQAPDALRQGLTALRVHMGLGGGLGGGLEGDADEAAGAAAGLRSTHDYLFRLQSVVADWTTDCLALSRHLAAGMPPAEAAPLLQALERTAHRYLALASNLGAPHLDAQLDIWLGQLAEASAERARVAELMQAGVALGIPQEQDQDRDQEPTQPRQAVNATHLVTALQRNIADRVSAYSEQIEALQRERDAQLDGPGEDLTLAIGVRELAKQGLLETLSNSLLAAEDAAQAARRAFENELDDSGRDAFFRLGFLLQRLPEQAASLRQGSPARDDD